MSPDGQRNLYPKNEGQVVMISAFQSREFGFGLDLSEAQIEKVNQEWRGEKYKDEESAISKHGTAMRPDLPIGNSAIIKEFEYGVNNQGYWCYEQMVLYFEDVVDCLKVTYPQYDYLFIFDHFYGHAKQRENGLNVQQMSKIFEGKTTNHERYRYGQM